MAYDFYINEMKVFGNKANLSIFASELAADYSHGPISFKNIIAEPQDTSVLENESWPGLEGWRIRNWGCFSDVYRSKVKFKKHYLLYEFHTQYFVPMPIFDRLIERNPELDFHIFAYYSPTFGSDQVEIKASKGIIIKDL